MLEDLLQLGDRFDCFFSHDGQLLWGILLELTGSNVAQASNSNSAYSSHQNAIQHGVSPIGTGL
ncbi:hypothetical protein D3C73_1637640 [compost metagenome]